MNSAANSAWQRIDAVIRPSAQEAVRLVQETLGGSVHSITVYGEAVTGGFDRRHHAVRSVVVMPKVDLDALRYLATYGPRLGKLGFSSPVVVTTKYVQDSLDTFPLEWIEVQQQGVTVYGTDAFASLGFDPCHVRLQCERELKRILMGMRQALLAAAGKERAVTLIEREVADTVLRTLRGMVWLAGRREHQPTPRVIEEVEKQIGANLRGVRAALDETARHDWSEFDRFYGEVELLMEKVNG